MLARSRVVLLAIGDSIQILLEGDVICILILYKFVCSCNLRRCNSCQLLVEGEVHSRSTTKSIVSSDGRLSMVSLGLRFALDCHIELLFPTILSLFLPVNLALSSLVSVFSLC